MDYYIYTNIPGKPTWRNVDVPTGGSEYQPRFLAFRTVITTEERIICYQKETIVTNSQIGDVKGRCFYILSKKNASVETLGGYVYWFNDYSEDWSSGNSDLQTLSPINDPVFFTSNDVEIPRLGRLKGGFTPGSDDWFATPAKFNGEITNDLSTGVWIGLNQYYATTSGERSLEKYSGNQITTGRLPKPIPWQYCEYYSQDFNNALDIALWLNTQKSMDYEEKNVFYDGYPLILDMYITKDYDQAREYLDTGKIPDDATKNESDGNGKPKPPQPPEPGNDDDSIETTPGIAHLPSQTAYSIGGVNVYRVSRSNLTEFIHWFWNNMVEDWAGTVINTLTGLYGNMSECVVSIKKMFAPSNMLFSTFSTSPYIRIGRYQYTTNTGCDLISGGPLNAVEVGTYKFDPHYHNFVDYTPHTTISLYLPYVGVIPLNSDLCMGRELSVYAVGDIHTMEIYYNLKINGALIGTYKGSCGMSVPFSLDNGMDIISNSVKSIAGLVATKNPLMLMGDVSAPIEQNTQASTILSMYDPGKCHIIIQRSRYKNPETYGNKTGYRLEEYNKLDNMSGYTVINDPVLDDITATTREKQKLKELLQGGVYL